MKNKKKTFGQNNRKYYSIDGILMNRQKKNEITLNNMIEASFHVKFI